MKSRIASLRSPSRSPSLLASSLLARYSNSPMFREPPTSRAASHRQATAITDEKRFEPVGHGVEDRLTCRKHLLYLVTPSVAIQGLTCCVKITPC